MFRNHSVRRAVAAAIRTSPPGEGTYLCHIVPGFSSAWAYLLSSRDSLYSGGALEAEYRKVAPGFDSSGWREVRARLVEDGEPSLLCGSSLALDMFILGTIDRVRANRKLR